ncbi:MAG: HAD hydrolase-like protein, partial [Nanoarchaeota archaeon]|nr:HAD hydrolase-like protein [Nanoarchaeota archaeon]
MIKTIIFDLNRVLVVPEKIDEDYQKAFGISQEEFWKPRKEFFKDHVVGKINLDQFLLKIMERNDMGKNKLFEAKKLFEKNISLVLGIKYLLISLQKDYPLILAAGDDKESLNIKLDKFGLKHYFKEIYAT